MKKRPLEVIISKMLASGEHNVGGSGEIESGPGGIRTPYLLTASQTFSQLNYGPADSLLIYHKKGLTRKVGLYLTMTFHDANIR